MNITPESLLAAGKSNDENFELLWKRLDCEDTSVKKLVLDKLQEEIDLAKKKENLKTQIESMTDSEKAKFLAKLNPKSYDATGRKLCTDGESLDAIYVIFISVFMFCVFIYCLVKLFS